MKKKFVLLLLAAAIMLCGCSRYECREEAKEYGESAVFYAEKYIDGEISAEEAYQNVSVVYDELDAYCDATHDDDLDSDIKLCETILSSTVLRLKSNLFLEDVSGGKIADIKSNIEDINKYTE